MLKDRYTKIKMDNYYKDNLTGVFASLGISLDTVASGDYIVINRKSDPDLQGTNNLVYKNRVYDVYLMN